MRVGGRGVGGREGCRREGCRREGCRRVRWVQECKTIARGLGATSPEGRFDQCAPLKALSVSKSLFSRSRAENPKCIMKVNHTEVEWCARGCLDRIGVFPAATY